MRCTVWFGSVVGLASLVLCLSCAGILGEYEVVGACSEDEDCQAYEKCAEWGECAARCLTNEDCRDAYRSCRSDHYCTKGAGEPCQTSYECSGTCTRLNSKAEELPSQYCAPHCENDCSNCADSCPSGMVCADGMYCYVP